MGLGGGDHCPFFPPRGCPALFLPAFSGSSYKTPRVYTLSISSSALHGPFPLQVMLVPLFFFVLSTLIFPSCDGVPGLGGLVVWCFWGGGGCILFVRMVGKGGKGSFSFFPKQKRNISVFMPFFLVFIVWESVYGIGFFVLHG